VRTRRFIRDALCAETPWLAIKKIRDGSSFRLFSRNVPSSFATPYVFLQKVSLLAPTCCCCTRSPLHTERVYVIPFRTAGRERYALRSVCLRFLTAKMRPRLGASFERHILNFNIEICHADEPFHEFPSFEIFFHFRIHERRAANQLLRFSWMRIFAALLIKSARALLFQSKIKMTGLEQLD
jgi:hypothetical protein